MLAKLLTGAVKVILIADSEEALVGLLGRQYLLLQSLDLLLCGGQFGVETVDFGVALVEGKANLGAHRRLHAARHVVVLGAELLELS